MFNHWTKLLGFLDLTTAGQPSFSKFVCVVILAASIAQGSLTLGVVIAVLAASFGRSVFLAFLNRRSAPSAPSGDL